MIGVKVDSTEGIQTRISDFKSIISNPDSFPLSRMSNFIQKLFETFSSGHKIAFVGNGGSAAEALHLAAEFTGKCVINHRPLPAMCLNANQSELTAIANDFGIEQMFARLVAANMSSGDLLICLSTSGKSENIINAINMAASKSIDTYLWTGANFQSQIDAEVWKVPSFSTPRIQEVHLIWGHIIAELLEEKIVSDEGELK